MVPLSVATKIYFVRTHRPCGILPIFQALAVARPLESTLRSARRHDDRSDGCLLYRWEPKRPGIRHDNHRVGLLFCQMLDYNAYHY